MCMHVCMPLYALYLCFRFSTRMLMRSLWLEIMMHIDIGYCACARININISVTVRCNRPQCESTIVVNRDMDNVKG